jgi:hypothetical protein
MPLTFTENRGQWDEQIRFRADGGGATMWFTSDGAYYQFTRRVPGDRKLPDVGRDPLDDEPDRFESMMIKASFVGANPEPCLAGEDMLEYKCNYFIGNDPTKWRADVANYTAVKYAALYPGIDLRYYGNGRQMEYDFIVSPGADYTQVQIRYEGARSVSVNNLGELIVETEWGQVIERRPVVYQVQDGARLALEGRYELLTDNTFAFSLESDHNPTLALVIDPVLSYSTFLGGTSGDESHGITVDAAGSAYVTGYTYSTDFSILNAYQQTHQWGTIDAFVTKLSPGGGSLVYSTYLGGGGQDFGHGISVDATGAAYIVGETSSSNLPTVNPYQEAVAGFWDAFVTKLSAAGNSLVYSTYLGGTGYDFGRGISNDAAGAAYVTGYTGSTDFPVESGYQETFQGNYDVFATKLTAAGNTVAYSTYLGGNDSDYGSAIVVDASGSAFVAGYTKSSNFPTENAYLATYQGGDSDGLVAKLSADGSSLIYSTYLGGEGRDEIWDLAVDAAGAAYLAGNTQSTDFPTADAYQENYSGGAFDVFAAKLSGSGNSVVFSTYLGTTGTEQGLAVCADGTGAAYVAGFTSSSDFPTENAYQETHQGGTWDAFVTKFTAAGSSLIYSTYLGGSGMDYGCGMTVDGDGAVYVTGYTFSTNFPAENGYQETLQGGCDGFVAKLSDEQTDVDEQQPVVVPQEFSLNQNHPNPFNAATEISFTLPHACQVKLEILNIAGQKVSTLVNRHMAAGAHTVLWDAGKVASGVYVYRLTAGEYMESRKMTLVK